MSLVGEVLGSYRITEELSSGGMGTVYRAQHELLARPAAIKVLRSGVTAPDAIGRFFTEARAASAIRHPNIVEVFDFGYTADGSAYLAMELLEGESLKTRLAKRGKLAEPVAVGLARGIASALAAAHAKGIFHRDLKPDNVIVIAGDHPKLVDFGVAKLADRGNGHTPTVDGTILGTPRYMAPEQARAASAVDHRADLYSLGCMLYEMVVGEPPFLGESLGDLLALMLLQPPEPPRARGATISASLEAVIMRLLQKEPEARFASADEVIAALAPKPRRRGLAIAVAGVALAAAAVVAVAFAHRDAPVAPTVPPAAPPPQPAPIAVQPTPPPPAPTPAPPPPPTQPVVSPSVVHHKPRAGPHPVAKCDGQSGAHDPQCSPIELNP